MVGKKCDSLESELLASKIQNKVLQEKLTNQESYTRKNNLKFVGVEQGSPGQDNCEKTILDLCSTIGTRGPEGPNVRVARSVTRFRYT